MCCGPSFSQLSMAFQAILCLCTTSASATHEGVHNPTMSSLRNVTTWQYQRLHHDGRPMIVSHGKSRSLLKLACPLVPNPPPHNSTPISLLLYSCVTTLYTHAHTPALSLRTQMSKRTQERRIKKLGWCKQQRRSPPLPHCAALEKMGSVFTRMVLAP